MRASTVEGRAMFATTRLLTELGRTFQDHPCRVCGETIPAGTVIRSRQWHLEHAHEQCGWFPPGDHYSIPVERRRPGTSFAYYEWRCPSCRLDACSVRCPRTTDDARCRRCRPAPELVEGAVVETVSSISFRVGKGKRPRLVRVAAYTRGELVKISGDVGLVRWETGGECWARVLVLKPV